MAIMQQNGQASQNGQAIFEQYYPPAPVAWTCPGKFGGCRGEEECRRQAENLGASVSKPWGAEYRLSPADLAISRSLGITWKADPDLVLSLDNPGRLLLQFGVSVRGQSEDWPDQMAWNFAVGQAEPGLMRRWSEDRGAGCVFAFVSHTRSIHLATPDQVEQYGQRMPWGWIINALEAGLPSLAYALKSGLPSLSAPWLSYPASGPAETSRVN